MTRHRWTNNTCIRCGITRERREHNVVLRTYSVLNQHGVFVDRQHIKFGSAWWYGEKYQFIRPDCKRKY